MKKLMSLFLVAVMTMAFAVSVMASPSSPDTGIRPVGDNAEQVIVTPADTDLHDGSLGAVDVDLVDDAEGTTVDFYVPGVQAGDTVTVLVTFPDGYMYEVTVTAKEDNIVSVEIKKDCKVEFVVKSEDAPQPQKPEEGQNGTNENGTNDSNTSPKTGETTAYPVACVMFVLFACVAVFAGRKAVR